MSTKKNTAPVEAEVVSGEPNTVIDDQEYEAAMEEARTSASAFTYEFKNPFTFEGETFKKLSFDFDALTGKDSLAIESELTALGRPVIVPELSGDYLIRMAMRACTTTRKNGMKLGVDAFAAMPIAAYIKIRSRARSFLMRAGS